MNMTHAPRSDWLNSYGMLKPSGPNLRRSCTMVCMKQSAYSMLFHCGCVTASSMSWFTQAYDALSPARTPAGASLVTLMDIWSRPMGNLGCGSVVIHSWKPGWMSSSLSMVVSTWCMRRGRLQPSVSQAATICIPGDARRAHRSNWPARHACPASRGALRADRTPILALALTGTRTQTQPLAPALALSRSLPRSPTPALSLSQP